MKKATFRRKQIKRGFYSALKAFDVFPYPHIESNELDSFPGTESYPFLDSATNASISGIRRVQLREKEELLGREWGKEVGLADT
jgi:hypothetical protein